MNSAICNMKKRKPKHDAKAPSSWKKQNSDPIENLATIQPIERTPLVPANASLTGLPPEIILQIFIHIDDISGACLALACKYLFSIAQDLNTSFGRVIGGYASHYRPRCLRLLKTWMSEDYSLCWICQRYNLVMYWRVEGPLKRTMPRPPEGRQYKTVQLWDDDDRTVEKKIRTEAYCLKCTKRFRMSFEVLCRRSD